jgi:hypothetical protein
MLKDFTLIAEGVEVKVNFFTADNGIASVWRAYAPNDRFKNPQEPGAVLTYGGDVRVDSKLLATDPALGYRNLLGKIEQVIEQVKAGREAEKPGKRDTTLEKFLAYFGEVEFEFIDETANWPLTGKD